MSDSPLVTMTIKKTLELASFDDFILLFKEANLVLFHIFQGHPDSAFVESYESDRDEEVLILLDRDSDKGFLTSTSITVDIIRTPKPFFVSRPLSELTGLGAWSKGTLINFETDRTKYGELLASARDFAFGSHRDE